jgi:hypothetical protein
MVVSSFCVFGFIAFLCVSGKGASVLGPQPEFGRRPSPGMWEEWQSVLTINPLRPSLSW